MGSRRNRPYAVGRIFLQQNCCILVVAILTVIQLFSLPALLSYQFTVSFDFEGIPGPTLSAAKITFIIPSTLARDSIVQTLESLQNQTRPHWEAIDGVDVLTANLTVDDIAMHSNRWFRDPRIRFVPITTASAERGEKANGSGEVRNIIIQQHATTEWVAFVDDDDTLSPRYFEMLENAVRDDPTASVVIFRMLDWRKGTLPPIHDFLAGKAKKDSVGISFAARREMFTRAQNRTEFIPHKAEDYNFLFAAYRNGKNVKMTNCTGYYARSSPVITEEDDFERPCAFRSVVVEEYVPPVFVWVPTLNSFQLLMEGKVIPLSGLKGAPSQDTSQVVYYTASSAF